MADNDELIEVDLPGGVKIKLPKVEADKVISGRDELKKSAQRSAEEAGRAKAEKDAADAAARKAKDDADAAAAAKNGEIDKVRELLTRESRERETKLLDKLKLDGLRAAIASNQSIVTAAIPDVLDQLKGRVAYDPATNEIVALDEAGRPARDPQSGSAVKVDTFVNGFLEQRPHYLKAQIGSGSGAAGARKQENSPTITADQMEAMEPRKLAEFFASGGKIAQ